MVKFLAQVFSVSTESSYGYILDRVANLSWLELGLNLAMCLRRLVALGF